MSPTWILALALGLTVAGAAVQAQPATSLAAEAAATSEPSPRVLHEEAVVDAPLSRVWAAWTTEEGLRFVSDDSNVELAVGGPYEWFLDTPPDADGKAGSQGSRILAYVPRELLAFAWTFPPPVADLRRGGETTVVVVRFDELASGGVRVRLDVSGWRDGPSWDAGWDYFDRAWSAVLARLKSHLEAAQPPAALPVDGVSRWRDGSVSVTAVEPRDKRQEFAVVLPAPPAEVWALLTTEEGLRRQGATEPAVELTPGGPYRLWPGNDHQRVMAWVPGEALLIRGSAPPDYPRVREGGTWSLLELTPVDGGRRTHLRVALVGWPDNDAEFDAAFDYFLVNNPRYLSHLHRVLADEAGATGAADDELGEG